MRIDVLGIEFDNVTKKEAVSRAMELISRQNGSYVVTPNPEIVWSCRSDDALRRAVSGASMVLPDGVGIIHGAKILGTPLREQIPGIDFITELLHEMAAFGKNVFLLGSKPGVADAAAQNLMRDIPGLVVAGTRDGYFGDAGPVIEMLNETAPDALLVCLGSPKQELFMAEHSGKLNTGLMIGLGGTLDIFSGEVKRAPKFMRRLGLEWFYRLVTDPRRIGRMMRLPLFLGAVIKKRFLPGKKSEK